MDVFILILLIILFLFLIIIRRKNIDIIFLGKLSADKSSYSGGKHVFFCFVDHFEPLWNGVDTLTAIKRVERWLKSYPVKASAIRDRGGRAAMHTFFYPEEEYIPECLDMLKELEANGYGDVEIHLHHNRDTPDGFRNKIVTFKEILFNKHRLLRKIRPSGNITYGFIHGNWALDDSGIHGRFCGVKNEISILRETGCYADFTYPSAPHPTQPPIINRIYYATDDPEKEKSHHQGRDAAFSSGSMGDLLIVTGPLAINWKLKRKWIFPAIENGDITGLNPPVRERVDLWIKQGIGVRGWPKWVFVKVHTHGAQESNSEYLLNEGINKLYKCLHEHYDDGEQYVLHHVTAWEMYKCVKVLESGDQSAVTRFENFDYEFDAS